MTVKKPCQNASLPPAEPSQRVGAFTLIPGLVRSLGGAPDAVLAEAGVPPGTLDHADNRIAYRSHGRLLAAAARHARCQHFGLVCGRAWQLHHLGLLGEIVRNGETVGDALRLLAVYHRLNASGGVAFFVDHAVAADLGYAIYARDVESADQIYLAVLAAGFNYLHELCDGARPVEAVLFPTAPPPYAGEMRRFFGCPVQFDADRAALRFRSHWLKRPVPGASAQRRRMLEHQALSSGPGDLVDRVERSLRMLLVMGRHSGDDVAQSLALHRRTLNRRLEAAGTSFQEVLDRVRFAVARQLLASGDLPMDEIAIALGYSGLSVFQRTFRRWSGVTPGRWRRDAQHGGVAPDGRSAPMPSF